MRRNKRSPGERLDAKSRTTMHSIDAVQAVDRGVQFESGNFDLNKQESRSSPFPNILFLIGGNRNQRKVLFEEFKECFGCSRFPLTR